MWFCVWCDLQRKPGTMTSFLLGCQSSTCAAQYPRVGGNVNLRDLLLLRLAEGHIGWNLMAMSMLTSHLNSKE